ncbi:glycosyltransferase family 39 protein [Pendulispora rubella]|uniref:Glycosyltransferase family 39 protein n=1 Tax=Pendulispora rubella TaxID=2741070 RepID=A0ABZ2L4B4_9BACT
MPIVLAAITLVFHLLTIRGYGYFRDEMYYLANGEHLGFGYVEHPPLIGIIAALVRAVLGTSLFGIRLTPALAGAATVGLTAQSARELGGGRFAQTLAGIGMMLAPVVVSLTSILSMNAFDILFWAICVWLVIRILKTDDTRLWLVFGAVAGIGLENKISILFLGFGVGVGLVLGRRWNHLRSRGFWLGAGLAVLFFVPYVVWQQVHGWPLREFMTRARELKNVALSPASFVLEQFLLMGPLSAPLWLGGLGYFLFSREAARYRALGWAYLAVLALFLVAGNAKPYYLAPAYTGLFAGGSVLVERLAAQRKLLRAAAITLVGGGGLLSLPLAKPVLSEDALVRYMAAIGMKPSSGERQALGRLPQLFADMHGWPELAETTARVYAALPPDERAKACIFAQNYGQAGAIDLFGPRYGLPKAISGHNMYWIWGPRDCTGEVLIVIGQRRTELEPLFTSVELGTMYTCVDCMPYENDKPIWIARGLRIPMKELWPRAKSFI